MNGTNPQYPLCAVELQNFMFAAKDTPTCMRKNDAPSFTDGTVYYYMADTHILLLELLISLELQISTVKYNSFYCLLYNTSLNCGQLIG